VRSIAFGENLTTLPLPRTEQPPARIQIQAIEPIIDCGRYPVKRTVGDRVDVYATVFKDGHDTLGGAVRVRGPGERTWREVRLESLGNDRFAGTFAPDRPGRWQFAVAAWTDRIATWQDEIRRKVAGGQKELTGELAEGAVLLGLERVTVDDGLAVTSTDRHGEVVSARFEVDVDRVLARFGAWYELFPRSFGGFTGVAKVLPRLAELGFDVVYLPPIHPIGETNRKGPNNALVAGPDDPGSPWAIGSAAGGHEAIDPGLGTWDDFDAMVAAARKAGLRDPVLARSSVAPRAPGVVQPAAGRDAQVRRESSEALPGHLQRQLRVGGLARPVASVA
jgi:starch synthase (maltosyl-transferring)